MAAAAFGGLLDSPPDGIPGVHSVEAKDYYTRKRVNGRWITGTFPKRQFAVKQAPKRLVVARLAPRTAPLSTPPPRPVPALSAPQPVADVAPSPPEPLTPPPNDERLLRLRAALQAHAKTLATGSLPRSAAERVPVPPPAPAWPDLPASAPSAAPQPAAIAFDLQTGLKRTTFTDGSVLEEEFDVEAVKNGAAPPKEPRGPGAGGRP